MTYKEFTELAGFNVREDYFYTIIEPKFTKSDLCSKDFVEEWKKQGGIQQAYAYLNTIYEIERNLHNDAKNENKELMYFLIDRSEKSADAELREYVIENIGFKDYISYKMEKGYNLWQLDKDEILKSL